MIIYKKPMFEDDSFMFTLNRRDFLTEISLLDLEYYNAKLNMFAEKNISKYALSDFCMRSSLRNFDEIEDLSGTVYTHTCEGKNKMDYEHILKAVKANYKKSRRCAINFADTLQDYLSSTKNTSCLNSIHYYKNNVTLYFRASDIENELLIDLHLIKKFFIDPVCDYETITVFASTAQNVNISLNHLIQ